MKGQRCRRKLRKKGEVAEEDKEEVCEEIEVEVFIEIREQTHSVRKQKVKLW
jgi:hypothetical protein